MTVNVLVIGEALIELAHKSDNIMQFNFAGDSYNTSFYLQQLGQCQVTYCSQIGIDNYSKRFKETLHSQSISTSFLFETCSRKMGLYLINNDIDGERYFTYYRKDSAASALFQNTTQVDAILNQIQSFKLIYLSGISVAVLDDVGRDNLLYILSVAKKNGVSIVFDNNYREALWQDEKSCLTQLGAFHQLSDILLLTKEDEQKLLGTVSTQEIIDVYQQRAPLSIIVLKDGASPASCYQLHKPVIQVRALPVKQVRDTTGAGDAFNAAFIHSYCVINSTINEAMQSGHRLASQVIQYHGAIINAIPEQALSDVR